MAINPENQMFRDDMFIEKERSEVASLLSDKETKWYVLVDPANTKNSWSDPAALIVLAVTKTGIWIPVELINKKFDPDGLIQQLYSICSRERGRYKNVEKIIFEQSGLQNTYEAAIRMHGQLHLNTLPPIQKSATSTKTSKEDRIDALQPLFQQGQVWFIKGTPGLAELKLQLLQHRNSPKHDDLMDALASGVPFIWTPMQKAVEIEEPKEEELGPLTLKKVRQIQELQKTAAQGGISMRAGFGNAPSFMGWANG